MSEELFVALRIDIRLRDFVNVRNLRSMIGTARTFPRSLIDRLRLIEIIDEDILLSGLILQLCPSVGRPCESSFTEDRLQRRRSLHPFSQDKPSWCGCSISRISPALAFIRCYIRSLGEHGSFVGVRPDHDVHIIVVTLLIKQILIVGDGITVDDRPEIVGRVVNQFLSIHLPKVGSSCAPRFFMKSMSLFYCFQTVDAIVLATAIFGPKEPPLSLMAALNNPFAQRRSTKNANRDGTGRFTEDGHLLGSPPNLDGYSPAPISVGNLIQYSRSCLKYDGRFCIQLVANLTLRHGRRCDIDHALLGKGSPSCVRGWTSCEAPP